MSYDIFDTKVTDVKIENKGDIVSDDNTNPEFIDICTIYSYRREHESKGEQAFIDRYMKDFTPIKSERGEIMAYKYDNANLAQGAPRCGTHTSSHRAAGRRDAGLVRGQLHGHSSGGTPVIVETHPED